jgi:rare lipoprotein A (peptidoglycan hydrolase)
MYGAVGNWKWGDTPYDVFVRNVRNGKEIRITITDYCEACAKGKNLIDLSPQAFAALGVPLSRGVQWVEITKGGHDGIETLLRGDAGICHRLGAGICQR